MQENGEKCCDFTFPPSKRFMLFKRFLIHIPGHLHNHVGLTENFDQSENEEFLVNDSP